MNHFTLLTDDLARSTEFYVEVLGLKPGLRPPLAFPGAWLYAGEQAVLHIIAGRELPEQPAGVLDHMAFSAENLPETTALLHRRGIEYSLRRQQESRLWQLFLVDPDGARVELVFAAEEEPGDEASSAK